MRWFDQKGLKIEGARLSTCFYSISQGSKMPEIRLKNGQISAALGQILIKPPQLSVYGLEENNHQLNRQFQMQRQNHHLGH